MTISVITPTLNSAARVRRTLQSISEQTQSILEYIVVDGGSTDTTISIVNEYAKLLPIRVVMQEPLGVYAAMNAGIREVGGDIICIINSDDYVYNEQVLARVVNVFMHNPEATVVYGDIVYKDFGSDKIGRYWRSGACIPKNIYNGWSMPHPAVFVRRSLYEKAGLFNENFRIAGDYEIMLRWLLVHGVQPVYMPETLVVMAPGGISGRSFKARSAGWRELRRAWAAQGLRPPFAFTLRRILFKLHQFIV